jgi:hypothetical protein
MRSTPTDAVYPTPVCPYVRTLLDAVPLLHPHGERGRNGRYGSRYTTHLVVARFRARCPALAAHDRRQCAEEAPFLGHLALDHAVACHFAGQGRPR